MFFFIMPGRKWYWDSTDPGDRVERGTNCLDGILEVPFFKKNVHEGIAHKF